MAHRGGPAKPQKWRIMSRRLINMIFEDEDQYTAELIHVSGIHRTASGSVGVSHQ